VISVWTLEPEEEGSPSSWSRQEVVRRREIGRQLTAVLHAYLPIRFDAFGERSGGTVLFWMEGAGLVQLNLGTKKAIVLWKGSGVINYQTSKALVHEVDLVSMLQCMKTF
jgi:streptomycin 6-kinase